MKTCIKCGEEKPVEQFPKYKDRKGEYAYYNECKSCRSAYKKKHYEKDKQAYLDRAKAQREKDPEAYKAYLKEYYRENKETLRKKQKEYMMNPEAQEMRRGIFRRYLNNPQNQIKNQSRAITRRAIANGIITRPNTCEICGGECKPEAHHEDYTKPLEVIWVCKQCHENIHHLNEGEESIG